jgi:cobalt-precorrin-5B (C1)-methyltransferase
MIGKLAKFAAGHESVHSRKSAQDFQFLARVAQDVGAAEPWLSQIRTANTAQAVSELAVEAGLTAFHDQICRETWQFATSLTQNAYRLDVLLLGKQGDVLGQYTPGP